MNIILLDLDLTSKPSYFKPVLLSLNANHEYHRLLVDAPKGFGKLFFRI